MNLYRAVDLCGASGGCVLGLFFGAGVVLLVGVSSVCGLSAVRGAVCLFWVWRAGGFLLSVGRCARWGMLCDGRANRTLTTSTL